MKRIFFLLMIVAGMAMTSYGQSEDAILARSIYEITMENGMKDFEPMFYVDVWFTRNTMVIDITSAYDTETTAKTMWKTIHVEWNSQTQKDICSQTDIVYMKVTIDDKYHLTTYKDKIIKSNNYY